MKLRFKYQQFQTEAVNAVAGLFSGQEKMQSTFEITRGPQLSLAENEFGIGNGIRISDEHSLFITNNVLKTQLFETKTEYIVFDC